MNIELENLKMAKQYQINQKAERIMFYADQLSRQKNLPLLAAIKEVKAAFKEAEK